MSYGKKDWPVPAVHITGITQKLSPSSWCFPSHSHPTRCELIFVTEGSGFLSANDQSFALKKGMIILIPPNVFHFLYCYANTAMEYNTLSFSPTETHPEILSRELSRPVASCTQGENILPQIQAIYELLFQCYRNHTLHLEQFYFQTASLICLCHELFSLHSTPLGEAKSLQDTDILMHQIYRFLTKHYADVLSLPALSRQFGISVSHLSHLFSKTFGHSPMEHQILSRITYSTTLLRKKERTIEEIAQMVGYSHAVNYIRQFKRRIGMTPSEYRQQEQTNMIRPGFLTPCLSTGPQP